MVELLINNHNGAFFSPDTDIEHIEEKVAVAGTDALDDIDYTLKSLWKVCATTAGAKALAAGAATILTVTGVIAFPVTMALAILAISMTALLVLIGTKKWHLCIDSLPESIKNILNGIRRFCITAGIVCYSAGRYLLPTLSSRENRMLFAMLEEVQQAQKDGLENPHYSETKPIVLIHGFMDNSNNFEWIKIHLEKAGLGPTYTVDLGHPWHSIDKGYRKTLNEKLQLIAAVHGRNDFAFVTHSMGGLVAADYVCKAAEENNIQVSDIVQLAPPAQGTKKAWIGIFATRLLSLGYKSSQACKQMRHQSAFIKDLNKSLDDKLNSGLRLYTMGSQTDPIIRPVNSSKYSAQNNSDHHIFDEMSHLQFLYSAGVVQNLVDYFFQRECEEREQ